MPFECRACGRIEEKRLRRPPDCPTKDLCDLRTAEIPGPKAAVHDNAATPTALEAFRSDAERARMELAANVARDEAVLRQRAAPSPGAILIVGGERFPLGDDTLLGRNGDVAFQHMRADTSVSRQHARVRCRDGRWSIENVAASKNTLRVGQRVISFGTACELEPGVTLIGLGERFNLQIAIE